MRTPDAEPGGASVVVDALRRMGLLQGSEHAHCEPLSGGVSSDIWRVDLPGRSVCVKRALHRLRVAAEWEAPVERSLHEWSWYETVGARVPGACPRPLARDAATNLFAMAYLPPEHYALWKSQLLQGQVESNVAAAVGTLAGRIHRLTAGDEMVARQFATDDCFAALRLDPYLTATAGAHPSLADAILRVRDETAGTRRALVHGDLSPKNILLGKEGPVLLDAECAWYGDPAFDVAFCANHLLLKCALLPSHAHALVDAARALVTAHAAEIDWEARAAFDARVARLLPALMLARIDGKSPVEYLQRQDERDLVRSGATGMLARAPRSTDEAFARWRAHLER